jgi:hypothetical protein
MSVPSELTWAAANSSHRFVGGFFSRICRFLDELDFAGGSGWVAVDGHREL